MLNLVISRSGYGKSYEIHKKIKELVLSGNDNVVIIIPEQVSFEVEKEMLELLGAKTAQKVDVMSFTRFCSKFFAKYGGRNKPYIDTTGKTAIMETALKQVEGELSLFKRQAKTSQFCEMLIDFSQKTKRYSVGINDFCDAIDNNSGILKQKLSETALIMTAYENLLNKDYFDPLDNLTVVGDMLDSCSFFEGKTVFLDSFTGFTLQQLRIIENIIKTAENTYISLGFDGIYQNAEFSTFSNIVKTANDLKNIAKNNSVNIAPDIILTDSHRFKNEELEFFERNIFAADAAEYDEKCKNIFITKANNIYDEADYVAKTIHNLVRTSDLRYRDIAVISRDANEYNGVIDEAFDKYDIPCFVDDREGVENLALFKYVEFALQAVINNFDSESIISMLKTGLTVFSDDDISLFEVYITVWQIDKKAFTNEFTGSVENFFTGTDEEKDDLLKHINEIREAVINPLCKLKNNLKGNTLQMVSAIYKFLKEMNCDKNLKLLAENLKQTGFIRLGESTQRSYDIFINVIDQLVLSLNNVDIDSKRFFELYMSAIKLMDIGSLPQGLDEVAVGSAERMRPKSPRVAFIIGANDGVFPSAKKGSGIFSDDELQKLKTNGILLPFYDVDTAVDEQYLAYCSLCSASEKVYVSYSKSTLSGQEKEPSIIVTGIQEIFPKIEIKNSDDIDLIENDNTALKIFATQNNACSASIAKYYENSANRSFDSIINAKRENIKQLSPQSAEKLYGDNIYTSASKIDVFHKCKFYYFCKYGIKANPIRVAKIDSLERGSLVHYVLEKVITDYEPNEFENKTDEQIKIIIEEIVANYLSNIYSGREMTIVEKYKNKKLVEMLVELVKRVFAELLQSEFNVYKTEFKIGGEQEDIPAYEVEFDGDKKVLLTGLIDRVDLYEKGGKKYCRIMDYKTGNKDFSLTDVLVGQNLQMLVYMIALQKNAKNLIGDILPSGIFYYPAKDSVVNVERGSTEKQIKDSVIKQVKMNGIILDEEESYKALEPSGASIYSPVKLTANGELYKNVNTYTIEQFGILTDHINKVIKDMGESIMKGDISVSPVDSSDSDACKYCDYHDVCFYDGEHQKHEKMSNDEAFETMAQEERI